MKKRVFFIGDFESNNGPGTANKILRKELSAYDEIIYSEARTLPSRILEMVWKIFISDTIFICNYTRLHIYAARLAKCFKKRCVYRLHGYQYYEIQINNPEISTENLEKLHAEERAIFKYVDKIICVSKLSMEFMKKNEPDYAHRFTYVYNGIDVDEIKQLAQKNSKERNVHQIMSTGGGIRQKNNRKVCEAIQRLRREGYDLSYIVVGSAGIDKEEICQYEFVKYYDELSREDVLAYMKQSQIYIQNSYMETFGVALVEAAICGCDIITSSNIGANEIFVNLESNEVIQDNDDIEEIKEKIVAMLCEGNNERIQKSLSIELIAKRDVAKELYKKVVQEEI